MLVYQRVEGWIKADICGLVVRLHMCCFSDKSCQMDQRWCLQSTSSKSPSSVHAVLSDRQVFQNTFIHIAGFSSTSKRKKSFESQNNLKRAIPEVVRNAFWYLLQFFVIISQWPSVVTVSGSAYGTGGCGYHPEPRTGPAWILADFGRFFLVQSIPWSTCPWVLSPNVWRVQ